MLRRPLQLLILVALAFASSGESQRRPGAGIGRRMSGARAVPGTSSLATESVDYIWEFPGGEPQTYATLTAAYAPGTISDTRWHTGEWTIDVVPNELPTAYSARHIAFSNGSNRLRLHTNVVEIRVDNVAYTVNVASAAADDTLTIRVDHGTEIGVRINGGAESTTAITGGETWAGRTANDWFLGNNSADTAGFEGDIYNPVAVP